MASSVAVIGMAGRFPKARNLDEFWANLHNGLDCISELSEQELLEAGVKPELLEDPNYVPARGVLDEIDRFDATLFGINPREAQVMDPNHRLFLECAYETLENAGYDPLQTAMAVGVFAGCVEGEYHERIRRLSRGTLIEFETSLHLASYLSTRVSYTLNLRGPSVFVFSACSTSLVAIVQASHSLLLGECDMALAGGAAIGVPAKSGYVYRPGELMSPDGRCRPFDAKANGTATGDGLGAVLLKRLGDAIADGDHIRAVIRGAALNNDGSDKVGFTTPSVTGQAEVIERALARSGIDPGTIGYVEAHGTATAIGDPFEVAALTRSFSAHTDKLGYCAIGSVKSNVGHLNTASGVAGFIKAVLALENRLIPPSLHFEEPNPEIDFASSPFYVNTEPVEWRDGDSPRRAAVSSFGVGGTNAHVILEEAPPTPAPDLGGPLQLLVLSAKTKTALQVATDSLATHLREHPELNLADVAYTTQLSRSGLHHRRAIVCGDATEAVQALEGEKPRAVSTGYPQVADPSVVFLFPGQGAQHVDMGRELYRSEPTFRAHVDHCAECLRPDLGLDLREVLYPSVDRTEESAERLRQTWLTQPAIFVVEYALAALWMQWCARPSVLLGHSVGELVAACLAGVFSLETGLRLVAARGRMTQDLPEGAMLSVALSENEARSLTNGSLSLAAINGPTACVISGPVEAVGDLHERLAADDIACQRLQTSHAFHSAMMDPIVEPFARLVADAGPVPASVPCVSTVTGTWIQPSEWADPEYWAKSLRQPVRFSDSVRTVLTDAERILLEVGPGQTLSVLARQHMTPTTGPTVLESMGRPQDPSAELASVLSTLGRLWIAGVPVDWSQLHAGRRRRRLPLPAYPFQRERYWVEPTQLASTGAAVTTPPASRTTKNPDLDDWFFVPGWRRTPTPAPLAPAASSSATCTLVFVDATGLGSALIERLPPDAVPLEIRIGARFERVGRDAYELGPASPDDFSALLARVRERGLVPSRVVHLWGLVAPDESPAGLDSLERSQARGFYSVMCLVQALETQFASKHVQIDVVTNDLFDVLGGEAVHPDRATVTGLCRVIPQEYPHIVCRQVDLQLLGATATSRDRAAEQLVGECWSDAIDPTVAYRGVYRWVQSFESARLAAAPAPAEHPVLRQGGVYLVTGGLGGIGIVLAQYLADSLQAKLVLTGRSGLPKRSQWDSWLARHDDQDRTSVRMRSVRRLMQSGAEVMVAAADATDHEQMRRVVARARLRFGAIHGVIHAAGINPSGFLAARRAADVAAVLAPKVAGTLILQDLLRDEPLDFFVLCSSVASIFGGIAFADYAAANSFLDAISHSQDLGSATPFLCINWDLWGDVGLGVDWGASAEILAKGIRSAEGVAAFERVLASSYRQVVVCQYDFHTKLAVSRVSAPRIGEANTKKPAAESVTAEPVAALSLHSRPELPQDFVAPRSELENSIAEVVHPLLGIDKIGVHDNFFDVGFDSLMAHRMIGRLRAPLGMSIPVRVILEIPTVAELAEFVHGFRAQDEPPIPNP